MSTGGPGVVHSGKPPAGTQLSAVRGQPLCPARRVPSRPALRRGRPFRLQAYKVGATSCSNRERQRRQPRLANVVFATLPRTHSVMVPPTLCRLPCSQQICTSVHVRPSSCRMSHDMALTALTLT